MIETGFFSMKVLHILLALIAMVWAAGFLVPVTAFLPAQTSGPTSQYGIADTGSIIAWSVPGSAIVLVNGEERGLTPCTIAGLAPGVYQVRLSREGYQSWSGNVTVLRGEYTTVVRQLGAASGGLVVDSSPAGANVSVDGIPRGLTPVTVRNLLTGPHTVNLSKIGFVPQTRIVNVSPEVRNYITVTLKPQSPGSDKKEVFQDALKRSGFTVQEGKLERFDLIEMYNRGIIKSCYGNNPVNPYMVYKIPSFPGLSRGGRITDSPVNPGNKGLWIDYFMNPDEAIVFVGQTPPEVNYFSYRSYIASRWSAANNSSQRIYASLGDTINNFRIKTLGLPGQPSGSPYGALTIIITTADRTTGEKVRAAAVAAGYPETIVNYDIIPSGIIRMGTNSTDDTISFAFRVASFRNRTKGEIYLNSTPGYVFRLTPDVPHVPNPYGVQPVIVRGSGDMSELDLMGDLSALREAIIASHGSGMTVTEKKTGVWLFEGFDALQQDMDAFGENRDSIYLKNGDFALADNEFVIVYGVNHVRSGKAVYASASPYGARVLNGVATVTDEQFADSTLPYLQGNPNAPLLYAWKFARHCDNESRCTEIPSCCGGYGIPGNESVFFIFRAYVDPATGVQPSWDEILYDQVIRFSPTREE
ncbi:MAG: PEGA domain-containing protein [Methanoregulaceae archaeon]|nr:PEGA domain-containing protein [Methanoregulaceae archaeon]